VITILSIKNNAYALFKPYPGGLVDYTQWGAWTIAVSLRL